MRAFEDVHSGSPAGGVRGDEGPCFQRSDHTLGDEPLLTGPDSPETTAARGTLAIVASSPGHEQLGAVARARALSCLWPGPVVLILSSAPNPPLPSTTLPDEVTVVAADTSLEKDLGPDASHQTRQLAVQALLGAQQNGKGKLERLYLLGDAPVLDLLPCLVGANPTLHVDLELLPSSKIPSGEELWPWVDSLVVSDADLAYPVSALQPSMPIRVVPGGSGRDAREALARLPGLGGQSKLSVLMPVRGGEEIVVRAVQAVLERTPELREIILVDDASPDHTLDRVARLSYQDSRIRILANSRQQGFGVTCNRGLAAARGDAVVILGADTVVTPRWSARLLEHLGAHPHVGAVAPYANRAPSIQRATRLDYDEQTLEGLADFSASFAASREPELTPVTQLSGICLAIPRRTLRQIGGFDPRFFPGGFEDEDWCARMIASRLIPCRAENVFIHHEGATSLPFEEESVREIHERGWRQFKEKWKLPPAWSLERGYEYDELLAGPYSRERHFIAPWQACERVGP